ITNALTSKMEIGSPLASMYLLGNPDHYTSHEFVPFYWRKYIVGKSNVDDYMLRPEEYSDVGLYDWIQFSSKRCKRRKNKADESETMDIDNAVGDQESETKYHQFQQDHPQYKTHEVFCKFENKLPPVPNFIGGFLPRRDQGDREHYCMTMLTLFKPWRSGLELKTDTQLWDESFRSHEFDCYASKLMDNFNLRYECLDARDN
ncbi:hypothetical protein BKA70DRAFT_1026192, partial [Coprinopsis sp. MPI-PUGE-AT-0042]